MTKSTKNAKPKATQSTLARALGISRQLVSYHIKAGCKIGLDDVGGWRDYLAEVGREGSLPPELREKIGRARARLIEAQAAKAERENKIAAGEMMPVADARAQNGAAWAFVFSELERLCNEVSPSLAGLPATDVWTRLNDFKEQMRKNAQVKFDEAA